VVVWFLLARFDLSIALAWLACWLAAGVGVPLLARRLGREPGRESVQRRAELSSALVTGVQGLPDLLVFGRGEAWLERLTALSERLAAAQRRSAWVTGLQTAAGGGLTNLALWLTLFLAIPLVRAGQMDGVYLAVAALIAQTGFEAVLPLPAAAQFLEANLQSARRLFDLVDARPAVTDAPAPLPAPTSADLRVRDLSFSYPLLLSPLRGEKEAGGMKEVLQYISFDLIPGKRLAIVGPSGAGKSTLINLLARFYEYERGEILLDGHDLRRYRQDDVRRMLAVLPQRAYLFSASLADNLRLAAPKASPERLEQAARLAGLHDWIATMPHGYDTWIGEGGVRLSGGQRQRLALARLLLRDAPLVLLDEPTAGLDAISERAVLASIFAALHGRSVLWVTHRLLDMERMDEIVVLEQGRLVQRGRHAELVEMDGVYRGFWIAQNNGLGAAD
jgi:thiol reductant ABC exporter CydC subunit